MESAQLTKKHKFISSECQVIHTDAGAACQAAVNLLCDELSSKMPWDQNVV